MGGGVEALMGAVPAAAAAGGNVNPLTAGLLGGAVPGMAAAKGMFPPMPEKNPAFHGGAQENEAAKAIKSSPAAQSAFASMMSKPVGPAPTPAAAPGQGGDSGGDFRSKPWKSETVFGNDVTGQNWKPSSGNIVLPQATPDAMPAPEKSPMFHSFAPAGGTPPAAAPSAFDTGAPKPPATAQAVGAAKPAPGLLEQWTGYKMPYLDDVQGALKRAPTNPLVQTGLGLAAAGQDGSNPWTNIAANLKGIQPHEIALRSADIADSAEGRKKKDAADEANDAQLRAMIAQMMMSSMPGATGASAGQGVASSQGQARLVR